MYAQVERVVVFRVTIDESKRVVRNHMGYVSRRINQFAVSHHRRIVVSAAASLVYEPVPESMLGYPAVAQVPFAADPAVPSVFRQHVGVRHLSLQIGSRIRPCISTPDPIMNAVL